MARNMRMFVAATALAMVGAIIAVQSGGNDVRTEPTTSIGEATAPALEVGSDTIVPIPPTTARRAPQMTLEQLVPRAPWRGPNRLTRSEIPRADFRRRLIPSSWDVIDNDGAQPEPGTLTLEFHEGVPGERPDWVGLHDGCQSSGWLIEWIEGDGDIGIIRRVQGTIRLRGVDCPDPFPNWPFPKGWVRVSFDGDQLILGRQTTDLLVERSDAVPVNPAALPTPEGELRRQILHGLWEVVDDDYAGARQPVLTIEGGHPDWIHTFDGCTRRSSWIREWTEDGFIAEAEPLVLSTRAPALETRQCGQPTIDMGILHDGPVDVVVTASGVELRRGDRTIVLDRR